ncbi:MAG: hypothetical protein D3908_16570, partial [Candidatus Electrothrix sp. AUS4]|nr:hypothetical protein [Candidatus Electrothrix sp. AUS4]
QYKGKIWLEILLAQGINDSNEEVEALRQAVQRMRLDRIQLNTVARPPLESFSRPLDKKSMEAIAHRFREDDPLRPVDLLAFQANQDDELEKPQKFYFNLDREADKQSFTIELVEMLKRRPCTAADINRTFHLGGAEKVELLLDTLVRDGRIQKRRHGESVYYQ